MGHTEKTDTKEDDTRHWDEDSTPSIPPCHFGVCPSPLGLSSDTESSPTIVTPPIIKTPGQSKTVPMAHFIQSGKRLSGQTFRITKGRRIRFGIWGPINTLVTPQKEVVIVSADPNIASVWSSNESITNNIRSWFVQGNNEGSTQLYIRPSLNSSEIWDTVSVEVLKETAQEAFINRVATEGESTTRRYGMPMSIMIAMAAKESGWGTGPHMDINSLFGITKHPQLGRPGSGMPNDWYPACNEIDIRKTPSIKGKPSQPDYFCKARNYQHAVEIWCQNVKQHPNMGSYQSLFKGGPWSEPQLRQLAQAAHSVVGFGKGNGQYGSEVMTIVSNFRLREFDSF